MSVVQAGLGLHGVQLGAATGYVPLRDLRALPHHVLQARRGPIGHAVFAWGIARGLAGLLVSLVRLRGIEFNANDQAVHCSQADHPYVTEAIETIAREPSWSRGPEVADFVRAELQSKVDLWKAEAENTTGGRMLAYDLPRGEGSGGQRGTTVESALQSRAWNDGNEFTCLNSLREVEPTVKLIMDDGGLDDLTDEVP